MKSIPEKVIDSWEDLMERKELKILINEVAFIYKFANEDDSEMAKNFRKRIVDFSMDNVDVADIVNKLLTGRYVTSLPTFYIEDCDLYAKKVDLCERIHVSRFGGATSSYFIALNILINKNIEKNLNKM